MPNRSPLPFPKKKNILVSEFGRTLLVAAKLKRDRKRLLRENLYTFFFCALFSRLWSFWFLWKNTLDAHYLLHGNKVGKDAENVFLREMGPHLEHFVVFSQEFWVPKYVSKTFLGNYQQFFLKVVVLLILLKKHSGHSFAFTWNRGVGDGCRMCFSSENRFHILALCGVLQGFWSS